MTLTHGEIARLLAVGAKQSLADTALLLEGAVQGVLCARLAESGAQTAWLADMWLPARRGELEMVVWDCGWASLAEPSSWRSPHRSGGAGGALHVREVTDVEARVESGRECEWALLPVFEREAARIARSEEARLGGYLAKAWGGRAIPSVIDKEASQRIISGSVLGRGWVTTRAGEARCESSAMCETVQQVSRRESPLEGGPLSPIRSVLGTRVRGQFREVTEQSGSRLEVLRVAANHGCHNPRVLVGLCKAEGVLVSEEQARRALMLPSSCATASLQDWQT
jgi:hypothetical protein